MPLPSTQCMHCETDKCRSSCLHLVYWRLLPVMRRGSVNCAMVKGRSGEADGAVWRTELPLTLRT